MSTRIAIDARELLGAVTGVGRYLGELLNHWTARSDAASRQIRLYAPEPLALKWPGVEVRVLPGGRGTWWEQTALRTALRREPPDVFFAPAYTAPLLLPAPLVVTIHDVSFSRHPEWFRWREGRRRHLLTRSAARRAAAVITVSEFSKREIEALYRVPAARIRVIANGLPPARGSGRARREPLALYVGSIFNRRRVPDLIAAFARIARELPDARLVIAGDNRSWPRQDLAATVAAHGIASQVQVLDFVSDATLDTLFARASVFAFLSEYEGFGLTPLEALASGVPCVVLDTEVAREIYGDAVAYAPPGDLAGTADVIGRLLTSRADGEAMLARAPAILSRYSWARAADQTLAVLEAAVER